MNYEEEEDLFLDDEEYTDTCTECLELSFYEAVNLLDTAYTDLTIGDVLSGCSAANS